MPNKKLKILTFATVAIVAMVILVVFSVRHYNPDLVVFLKNNRDVQMSLFEISGRFDGERRTIALTNPVTLRYLSERFRTADSNGPPGYVYDAKVILSNGGKYNFPLDIPKGGRQLTAVIRTDWKKIQDPEYYGITLIEPVPVDLSNALEKLTSPEYVQEQSQKR